MYLRKSKKPNGRTYLTIVQGYRDEDGKNRARTVKSLGYVDALEAELDDPVAHFEEECRRMTAEAARAEEDGFRMRGVSKEHRPSPIVQMGLFLDSDGLPLGYELFPGNRNDMTTLLPAMSKAGVRDLPRGGAGGGRGRQGPQHLREHRRVRARRQRLHLLAVRAHGDQGARVVGARRRGLRGERPRLLQDQEPRLGEGGLRRGRGRQKAQGHGAGEGGGLLVARLLRAQPPRAREGRGEVARRRGPRRHAVGGGQDAGALREGRARRARDRRGADHNWVVDEERIAADEAMDGYYCIVTSEQDMDDREVIDAYRGLWRIEESFRVMKGDLGARPVYCSTESHIHAHFLVCYVALLAMRLMQLDTGRKYSAAQISEALAGVTGHLVDRNLYLFDYRTDLTDELAGAVGIDLSRQVLTRGQIRSIMADVRKPRS